MADVLQVERRDAVTVVRLNRPEKMNALDDELIETLIETGRSLARDPGVRAVVLCGNGPGFCGGLDTAKFAAQRDGAALVPEHADGPADRWGDLGVEGLRLGRGQQAVWVWKLLPVPVVVAVHGAAVGAGLQLALAGDVRFAGPDAKLGALEIRWGIMPDMGGTQLLPGLIGLDRARDLIYTGRVVRGDEAGRWGLVTHVADDPLESALRYADAIAEKNPHAIRNGKALTALAEQVSREGLVAERRAMWATVGSPNQLEAVRAAVERRPAVFADWAPGDASL
ncbi:crotonase/enoyl-CoA hydratase family protein [Nonomuraea wenchangensis]|uniref:crotonase/enoyl-CoA hydratase family protein n=1 Tax=Nonomuraea wenchangensis TaxID=568860 RepID=UPI0034376C65